MVTGAASGRAHPAAPGQRLLALVALLALAALVLVIAGGIYLAAQLPRPAPLAPAVAALAGAAAALLASVAALSRLRRFAWRTFFQVARWTLGAYLVIAGMLEFVFVLDHTPGTLLTILTLMLAVFAVDIPLMLAFAVARCQPADPPSAS